MSDNSEKLPDPSSFFRFIRGSSSPQPALNSSEHAPDNALEMAVALARALKNVPHFCPQCGGLCDQHVIRIRDAFMTRTLELVSEMHQALLLYQGVRSIQVQEPSELIERIYTLWAEASVLFELTEPQEYVGTEDESAEPEEDD